MIWFRIPTIAVVHSEDIFYFVRYLCLGIVTDELTHSSPESDVIFQVIDRLLRRLHGVDIRKGILPTKIWAIVTPESMTGVSENMVSVASAAFLLGMLKAGHLDLKCFLMGNLVGVTAH